MLKAIVVFLAALSLFISCSGETNFTGKFGFEPNTALPGDEVVIFYNPDSTNLTGRDEIQCIAYLYNNDLNNTLDIPLSKNGNIYSGKVKTGKETMGILLKFKADEVIDNNSKNGYVVFLSDQEGNKLAGSIAGYAAAINRWGAYYSDLDRDKEKALRLFNEEFETNPEIKVDFMQSYLEAVYAVKLDDREQIILKELQALETGENISEKEYELLAKWYAKIEHEEKSEYYEKIIEEKYTRSDYLQEKLYGEFRAENDVQQKIEHLIKFEKVFPESKYVKSMYDLVANSYRDAKDYRKAHEYLKMNVNKVSPYRFFIVVKRMLEENADMDTAMKIAELGEKRNRIEVENPTLKKPEYFSESEWKADREYYLGLNQFYYGSILYKTDRKKESLSILEEAVKLTKGKEGDINELYSKALLESGEFGRALDEIASFIQSGHSTVRMKSYLQEAYINEKGTVDGFEKFSGQFENEARERLISKLKNEMILEPAPEFVLSDLRGNTIKLSDFKGKTVILDFWATWCGPCLASFPGMKMAVEKFSDNPSVKFLFVNSWERVDNKRENAEEFIAKNEYPFHVLLDTENKVIENYKVSGIPTKFIVDGNGNIRFMSIGFQGTEDQLVEELSLMISLLN